MSKRLENSLMNELLSEYEKTTRKWNKVCIIALEKSNPTQSIKEFCLPVTNSGAWAKNTQSGEFKKEEKLTNPVTDGLLSE